MKTKLFWKKGLFSYTYYEILYVFSNIAVTSSLTRNTTSSTHCTLLKNLCSSKCIKYPLADDFTRCHNDLVLDNFWQRWKQTRSTFLIRITTQTFFDDCDITGADLPCAWRVMHAGDNYSVDEPIFVLFGVNVIRFGLVSSWWYFNTGKLLLRQYTIYNPS